MNNKESFHLNKLVRDKIPQIMKSNAIDVDMKILNQDEFLGALKNKLLEESKEVFEATSKENLIEELADVLEVINAIKESVNISGEEIENIRQQKSAEKGKFLGRIFIDQISMERSNKNFLYYENKFK